MSEPNPAVSQRLLRGYGPLVGFAAMFAAISLLVPTVRQEIVTEQAASSGGSTNGTVGAEESSSTSTDPGAVVSADSVVAADGSTAGGTGSTGSGSTGTKAGSGTKSSASGTGGTGAAGTPSATANPGQTVPCGAFQVANDPYSPPCYKWGGGDNFGATSMGVTADKITITARIQAFDNGLLDALSRLANAKIPNEPRSVIENTIKALVQFANDHFTFYGRKLDLQLYEGVGKVEVEVQGGGQDGAERDADKVGKDLKAFADISGISPPYVEALAKRKVLSFGAPYLSRDWLTRVRPYAWSPLTDCSTVVESVGSFYNQKLGGKPATLAEGALKGQPRKVAIIAPDNSWYQECVNAGIKIIQDGGHGGDIALNLPYKIDLSSITPQADAIMAKLKGGGITTVICGCDPIMLSTMTGKATGQGYYPEWEQTGVAFTDQDLLGSIMDKAQWKHAFGVAFSGQSGAIEAGIGYQAAKSVLKNQPVSQAADLIYSNIEMLAIGIQMAGPKLTPESFEKGMFSYPQRTGSQGTWKFGPGDYTTSQDAREVYWDPRVISPQSKEPGSWIDATGKRFPIGQFPAGDPKTCGC